MMMMISMVKFEACGLSKMYNHKFGIDFELGAAHSSVSGSFGLRPLLM